MESRLTCDTFTFYYNGVTKKTNFWVKFKAEFWGDNIDLTDLDGDFSKEEIKKVVSDLGTDKAQSQMAIQSSSFMNFGK